MRVLSPVCAFGLAAACSATAPAPAPPRASSPPTVQASAAPPSTTAGPVRAASSTSTPTDAGAPQDDAATHAAVDADAGATAPEPEPEPEPEPPRHAFHATTLTRTMPQSAPSMRYANLSPAQCRKELARRKLKLKRWHGAAKGVATPLRFDGDIGGIRYVAPGGKSPYGILDCRLALTLDELAKVLKRHDVVEVRLDNIYRPGAKLPGRRSKSQHAHGLAADITVFKLADGRRLVVEEHWLGERGAPACGPDAEISEETDEAIRLRNLYCEVAGLGLFHTMLSPGHDKAHEDHFHWDIKRDAKWRSVR